jgi:hypothetical protein
MSLHSINCLSEYLDRDHGLHAANKDARDNGTVIDNRFADGKLFGSRILDGKMTTKRAAERAYHEDFVTC